MEADIDIQVINAYLKSLGLEGIDAFYTIHKLTGGRSNPNYLLSGKSGKYVLRRQPYGAKLRTAHNLEREYKVIGALEGSGIPVPKRIHLCTDQSVLEVHFYIMKYVEGDISADFQLRHIHPELRRISYFNMIDLLAKLHNLNVGSLGLADFGREGNYFQRQYHRWEKSFRISLPEGTKHFNQLSSWLYAHLPKGETATLIHGDFRLDNMIFDEDSREIKALLDWELSTLGDPLSDLGYFLGVLNTPSNFVIPGLMEVDREAMNIPSETALLERYCKATGRDSIEQWPFYKAFGFFRLSAICAGIQARVIQGNAVDESSRLFGSLTDRVAEIGLSQIE